MFCACQFLKDAVISSFINGSCTFVGLENIGATLVNTTIFIEYCQCIVKLTYKEPVINELNIRYYL